MKGKCSEKEEILREVTLVGLAEDELYKIEQEVKTVQEEQHPLMLPFTSVYSEQCENHSTHILVQDYLPNGTLMDELFQRKTMQKYIPEDELIKLFVDICLVVKKLQDKNIQRLNLTSKTIFVDTKEPLTLKIGGFLEASYFAKHGGFQKAFDKKYEDLSYMLDDDNEYQQMVIQRTEDQKNFYLKKVPLIYHSKDMYLELRRQNQILRKFRHTNIVHYVESFISDNIHVVTK